jgi:hypothetical protein
MKNDELNELAIKIYKAHRDALDFIFDNRPDPATELISVKATTGRSIGHCRKTIAIPA